MRKTWFAILMTISLLSCDKENLESKLPVKKLPVVTNLPVTITVDESHPGYTIPATFEGLSYETGILVDSPEFLNENNKVLIQLIKNLVGVFCASAAIAATLQMSGSARTAKTPANTLTSGSVVCRHLTKQ